VPPENLPEAEAVIDNPVLWKSEWGREEAGRPPLDLAAADRQEPPDSLPNKVPESRCRMTDKAR
jgi:hypothetical protein